jgi:hypothetical protein
VGIHFANGVCRKCAARVRADLRSSAQERGMTGDGTGWVPGIAVVALSVMVVVLLIARPVHELPAPAHVALDAAEQPAPPMLVIPEPEPAASSTFVSPPRVVRAPALTTVPRPRRVTVAEARAPQLSRPVVYRTRAPRDSTQSP